MRNVKILLYAIFLFALMFLIGEIAADELRFEAALTFTPPTHRENGKPVEEGEIASYVVRYAVGDFSNPATFNTDNATVPQFININSADALPATLLFQVAAVDKTGLLGLFSEIYTVEIARPSQIEPLNIDLKCVSACKVSVNDTKVYF